VQKDWFVPPLSALRKTVDHGAIEAANEEVTTVLKMD